METKKNVHILYIITKLELGGAQKTCLSLFNNCSDSFSSTWLISGEEGILTESIKNNPNVFLLSSLKREYSWSDIKAFFDIFSTIKKLKSSYPNLIVHTHSTKAGYLGRWAAWLCNIKNIIHTVHGFGFHEHQSKFEYTIAYLLEKITSLITTKYICVSSADQAIGIQSIRNFKDKQILIRAAVEDSLLIPAKKDYSFDGSCIFGTIACFKPQKNLFDLLEAFKQVHFYNQQMKLEIIGDGYLKPEIEKWINQNNLSRSIILHGWQNNPNNIMQNWDCFVLSSLWEGLPCALVEARFLELPIIAYDVGGISDIIKHGKNGYLCQPKNKVMLAHYMNLLGQNNYLRKKMSEHKEDLHTFNKNFMIKAHKKMYSFL